ATRPSPPPSRSPSPPVRTPGTTTRPGRSPSRAGLSADRRAPAARPYVVLTMITEHAALCATLLGTLPRMRQFMPLLPTTSTSAPCSDACDENVRWIAWAGDRRDLQARGVSMRFNVGEVSLDF